jgi:hypothetical protein
VDYPLTIYGSNGVAFFPNPVSFGSTITTPTQANTDNTTNVATTAFVQNAVSTINTNLFNNYATISYANQFVNPNWGATFTASLQFQSSPIQLIGSDLYSGCGGSIISLDNGASNQQFMFANSTDGQLKCQHQPANCPAK